MKRFVSILLLLALLLGCLPVSVLAAGEEGYFYFSAESKDTLLIAPVKISYEAEQTVREALLASKYSFTTNESSGFITAIEGVNGSYICCADCESANPLTEQASSVQYAFFTEDTSAVMTDGRVALMQAMAGYLEEAADVQKAAEQAYQDACSKYPNIDSNTAINCANAITSAIETYRDGQNTKHKVTFSGYADADSIYAVNEYGKRVNGANGSIELPNGNYTFYIYKANKAVSGTLTVNGREQTINDLPTIPTDAWINEGAFEISTTSGVMSDADFENGAFKTMANGEHGVSATLYDTFSGLLYPYVELNSGASGVTLSAIYKNAATGETVNESLAPKSKATALYNVLSKSAKGNEVIFRASQTSGNYTLLEDFTLTLNRTLTLSGLRVTNESGTPQIATESFSPDRTAYTYKVLDSEKTLKIYPTASASGVSVTVNGTGLNADGYASVDISKETQISIVLTAGDYTSTYTLTIEKGAASKVKLTLENADSVVVKNSSGEILTPSSSNETSMTYTLVVGQQYSYYATRDTYYHIEKTFTLTKEDALRGYKVNVPLDKMPSISELYAATMLDSVSGTLNFDNTFSSTEHEYTTTIADTDSVIYAWGKAASGTYETSPVCTVRFNAISKDAMVNNTQITAALPETTKKTGTNTNIDPLKNALLLHNAYGNTLTFNVAHSTKADATGSTTTYSTDYVLHIKRDLTLQNLAVSGTTLNFSGTKKDYTITVPAAQSTLSLTATAWGNARYNDTDGGYDLYVNGKAAESGKAAEINLSGTSETETVTVKVESREDKTVYTDYTLTVQKAAGSTVKFVVQPSGALLYIFDKDSGNRVWPDDSGACALSTGFTYGYSVTMPGYVGTSGYFKLEDNNLVFGTMKSGEVDYTGGATHDIANPYSISLTEAQKSTLTQFEAAWPNFRGNAANNGVTTAKTPVNAEDGTLYWAVKAGEGYSGRAVSSPILVNGYLYAYAGSNLLKIDKDTGKVLTSGIMAGSSSYSIVPPTYADGMILVGLANGLVQAFNAETLESLWVYADLLGGQPNSPITVHGGYAYTGFWNSETGNAAFVCLSLTDEAPNAPKESKSATWRYVQKGGFYWAGAYACDEFVMVGTDDGTSGMDSTTANLLLFAPETGKLLDSKTNLIGDIRSTICYDSETNAYYFTTKGGYFYKVTADKQTDGTYKLDEPEKIDLGGMSTSTPVIYNGRAYVGVSGAKQFGGSGYNIAVIDLGKNQVAYRVPTNGYPQTSGLLTTAYSDYNYVYFIENTTPGTLRLLRDKPEQTAVDTVYQTKETAGTTAYALFTPAGKQAQYAICSPIADENGTLYFKNDSGYLMAFGSAIEKLVVTKQPNKTHYSVGETFDPTGMAVTAKYKNGLERDVTAQISYKTAPLSEDEQAFSLLYGSGRVMYHNKRNDDGTMESGVETTYKAEIPITVGGKGGTVYDKLGWTYKSGKLTLSGTFPSGAKLIAAMYDETGKMTAAKAFDALGSEKISGAKIKLFLLDSTGKPLCAAVTVTDA